MILYIISDQRSGSTLLENILSKSSKTIPVGELRLLYNYIKEVGVGNTERWKCSCGEKLVNCNFWSAVLNELNVTVSHFPQTKIKGNGIFIDLLKSKKSVCNKKYNQETLSFLGDLYTEIFKKSEKNIIIDSSKNPMQGICVYDKVKYPVKIIYLKRDLRAITYSKVKWKEKLRGENYGLFKMLTINKLRSFRRMRMLNFISPKDKVTIHYKDLATNTSKTLKKICNSLSLPYFDPPEYMYVHDDIHTIAGTPNKNKKRKIKYDDSWRRKMRGMPFFRLYSKILNIS